jgi:hypothetical protein
MNVINNDKMSFVFGIPRNISYISGFNENMTLTLSANNFAFVIEKLDIKPLPVERWYILRNDYELQWHLVEIENKPITPTAEIKIKQ